MPEPKSGTSTYATILAGAALDGFNAVMTSGITGPLKPVFVAYGQVLGQGVGQGIANKVPLPVEIALAEVGIATVIAGTMLAPTAAMALTTGAIAFAASATIVALYEGSEPFRNALDAQADWVVDVNVAMGEWIGRMHQDMQAFQETLSSNIDTAISQITEWVDSRISELGSAWNQIVDGLGNGLDNALLGLRDFLDEMKDITRDIMNGNFSGVSESILDYLDNLFGSPGDATPVSDALASAGQWFGDSLHSPLVFDLGGQGLDLLPLSGSPTFFDFDGDLFKEQAGWVKPTDGFLVVDRNAHTTIPSANDNSIDIKMRSCNLTKNLAA